MPSSAAAKTTTPTPTDSLPSSLRKLGLLRMAEDLDDVVARATRLRWGARALLEELAKVELEDRARRSVERRLKAARLVRFKTMADWEWDWPRSIDHKAVDRVLAWTS